MPVLFFEEYGVARGNIVILIDKLY